MSRDKILNDCLEIIRQRLYHLDSMGNYRVDYIEGFGIQIQITTSSDYQLTAGCVLGELKVASAINAGVTLEGPTHLRGGKEIAEYTLGSNGSITFPSLLDLGRALKTLGLGKHLDLSALGEKTVRDLS